MASQICSCHVSLNLQSVLKSTVQFLQSDNQRTQIPSDSLLADFFLLQLQFYGVSTVENRFDFTNLHIIKFIYRFLLKMNCKLKCA
jgi:hypothetical protein